MTELDGHTEGYDIIGDIHGSARALVDLLKRLDYQQDGASFYHPSRKVIFVGDIVDRGPYIRSALKIVKTMVDEGQAYCLLGNHEFNAVAHTTFAEHEDADARFLRKHSTHPISVDRETLMQFENYADEWEGYVQWFSELPLFLDFDAFRVVHACWDSDAVQDVRHKSGCDEATLRDILPYLVKGDREITRSVDRLTRGTNLRYPEGRYLLSRDGVKRSVFRTKFWAEDPEIYDDVVFQPDPLPKDLQARPLDANEKSGLVHYPESEKPLFFGHYWLDGKPETQRKNLACLDYSAVKFGRLVCYRYDGESVLNDKKFVWVYVDPIAEFEI